MAIDNNPDLGKVEKLPNNIPEVPNIQSDFKKASQPALSDPVDAERMKAVRHEFKRQLNNQSTSQASKINIGKDPFKNYDPYQFSTGRFGSQPTERFSAHPGYKRLGFNPWMDNDSIYKTYGTKGEEFTRTFYESGSLFGLGFSSYWGDASERTEADEYGRVSRITNSDRGGAFGLFNNTYSNLQYTLGLISEVALEEVGLALAATLTEGAAAPAAIARTGFNMGRIGRAIYGGAKAGKGMYQTIKQLGNYNKAKSIYNVGNIAKRVARGPKSVLKFANPARNTFDFIKAVRAGNFAEKGLLSTSIRGFGSMYADTREIGLALDESQLEAGFIANTIQENLIKTIKDNRENDGKQLSAQEYQDIAKIAYMHAKRGYNKNAMLIYGTNKIAYSTIFRRMSRALRGASARGQFAGGRMINNKGFIKKGTSSKTIIEPGLRAEGRYLLSQIKNVRKAPLVLAQSLGRYTLANSMEGVQEYFQEVIQDAEAAGAMRNYNPAADKLELGLKGALNEQYLDAFNSYLDHRGFEVFMSGFLIGGGVRIYSGVAETMGRKGTQAVGYVGKKAGFTVGKYKEHKDYKAKAWEESKKKVEEFDEKIKNVYEWMSIDEKASRGARAMAAAAEMDEAEDKNDVYTFLNIKEKENQEFIIESLKNGNFDIILDGLSDMTNMTGEELIEAFGNRMGKEEVSEEDINAFKENAPQILELAKDMKSLWDKAPKNPNKFIKNDDGTDRDVNLNNLRFIAFEQTKKDLILSQVDFSESLDRLKTLTKSFKKNVPFFSGKADEQAMVAVIDAEYRNEYMGTLLTEIQNLESELVDTEKTKEEQEKITDLLTEKNKALKSIAEIANAINSVEKAFTDVSYTAGMDVEITLEGENKRAKIIEVDDKNYVAELSDGTRVTIPIDEATEEEKQERLDKSLDGLKKSYINYLNAIKGKDDYVKVDMVDQSLSYLVDYMRLNEDNQNLISIINKLSNPEFFGDMVDARQKVLQSRWDNRKEDREKARKAFQESAEKNELMRILAEKGIFIGDEGIDLLNKEPNAFVLAALAGAIDIFDYDTLEGIDKVSGKYKIFIDEVKAYEETLTTEEKEEETGEEETGGEETGGEEGKEKGKEEGGLPDDVQKEFEEKNKEIDKEKEKKLTEEQSKAEKEAEDLLADLEGEAKKEIDKEAGEAAEDLGLGALKVPELKIKAKELGIDSKEVEGDKSSPGPWLDAIKKKQEEDKAEEAATEKAAAEQPIRINRSAKLTKEPEKTEEEKEKEEEKKRYEEALDELVAASTSSQTKAAPVETQVEVSEATEDQKRQKELENKVEELKAKDKTFRNKDGSVPKENMKAWEQNKKDLREAEKNATRGSSIESPISIKLRGEENEKNRTITGEEAKIEEEKIEALIQLVFNGKKTADEIIKFISDNYAFGLNDLDLIKNYINDRTSDAPKIGNNKAPFPIWRRGETVTEKEEAQDSKTITLTAKMIADAAEKVVGEEPTEKQKDEAIKEGIQLALDFSKGLTKKEEKAVDEVKEKDESHVEALYRLIKDDVKVGSKILKDLLFRIRKFVMALLIGIMVVHGGKTVASTDIGQEVVTAIAGEDVANAAKMPYLDMFDLAINYVEKKLEMGSYADVATENIVVDEEALALEAEAERVAQEEALAEQLRNQEIEQAEYEAELERSRQESLIYSKEPITFGKSTYTYRNGNEKKSFIIDLGTSAGREGVKFELAHNTKSSEKTYIDQPNKEITNSYGIIGGVHNRLVPFSQTSNSKFPVDVQIAYNTKTKVLTAKKTEDLDSNDLVIPYGKKDIGNVIKVEDLDITKKEDGSFDIKMSKAKGGNSNWGVIGKKGRGTFGIGLSKKTDWKDEIVNSKDLNNYRVLRGAMVIIFDEEAEVSVLVGGSPNQIFSVLSNLQNKYPEKKWVIFKGDTGSYTASSFEKDGKTSIKDINFYSNQNNHGETQFLILKKPEEAPVEEPIEDPIDPDPFLGMGLALAALRKRKEEGQKITKEDVEKALEEDKETIRLDAEKDAKDKKEKLKEELQKKHNLEKLPTKTTKKIVKKKEAKKTTKKAVEPIWTPESKDKNEQRKELQERIKKQRGRVKEIDEKRLVDSDPTVRVTTVIGESFDIREDQIVEVKASNDMARVTEVEEDPMLGLKDPIFTIAILNGDFDETGETQKVRYGDINNITYKPSTDAGSEVDDAVTTYLKEGKIIEISNKFSESGKKALEKTLEDVRKLIIGQMGWTIVDVHVKVFDKKPRFGKPISGEMDILVQDELGMYHIIDIKTKKEHKGISFRNKKTPAGPFATEDPISKKYFSERLGKERSSLEQYSLQQSVYKNVWEKQYGVKIESLLLLPIGLKFESGSTIDDTSQVVDVALENVKLGARTPFIPVNYRKEVEEYVDKVYIEKTPDLTTEGTAQEIKTIININLDSDTVARINADENTQKVLLRRSTDKDITEGSAEIVKRQVTLNKNVSILYNHRHVGSQTYDSFYNNSRKVYPTFKEMLQALGLTEYRTEDNSNKITLQDKINKDEVVEMFSNELTRNWITGTRSVEIVIIEPAKLGSLKSTPTENVKALITKYSKEFEDASNVVELEIAYDNSIKALSELQKIQEIDLTEILNKLTLVKEAVAKDKFLPSIGDFFQKGEATREVVEIEQNEDGEYMVLFNYVKPNKTGKGKMNLATFMKGSEKKAGTTASNNSIKENIKEASEEGKGIEGENVEGDISIQDLKNFLKKKSDEKDC
jgi:hypothetical protein